MEVTIVFLKILGGNIFHDDFTGYIPGGGSKESPTPYVATPEVF